MVSRDRVHNRFLVTRDALDWKNFQESRDSVKRRLSKAERKNTSEEVQLHKHNPNSLGKIINRVIPYKNQERLTYSKDLTTTANKFDRFFSSVGRNATNASIRLAEENNITLPEPSPETVPLIPDELFRLRTPPVRMWTRRVILSLPSIKSPGSDRVSARIIKDCLPVILGPITEIINCSIITNTFPTTWKTAEVMPILKDGDH